MAVERNRRLLQDLLENPGNEACADCGAPDRDWASYTLGIFICLNCSGIHRNIPQVSKVKSVRLDAWEDDEVKFMASNGNTATKAKYESKLPAFYYRPTFTDCHSLPHQLKVLTSLEQYRTESCQTPSLDCDVPADHNIGYFGNSGSVPSMKERNLSASKNRSLTLQPLWVGFGLRSDSRPSE